jgi:hypothetical protein
VALPCPTLFAYGHHQLGDALKGGEAVEDLEPLSQLNTDLQIVDLPQKSADPHSTIRAARRQGTRQQTAQVHRLGAQFRAQGIFAIPREGPHGLLDL